ncbi:Mu transposase C-terminal domain-containing protein [Alteromonas sp. AMM-1]|uniref:Mu transposase C-terminal domain-containing protein n=1 Tax=Alteromonas sp. AMM-1 TaxID=3394233 RepID=UPI0039A4E1E7
MGKSKRTITLRANREEWSFVSLEGRGGLIPHYHADKLPSDIQLKLRETQGARDDIENRAFHAAEFYRDVETKRTQRDVELKRNSLLTAPLNLEGNKRASVTLAILKLAEASINENIGKTASWNSFVELYNKRELDFDDSTYQIKPHLSLRTLLRWEKAYSEKGVAGITPKYGKTKGKGIIDSCSEMSRFCVALIHEFPHVKGERLAEFLQMEFEGKYELPSPSTCRKWLKTWKQENHVTFMSLVDASGWQNKMMVAFGSRSAVVERINQLWEFDSTPSDVNCNNGRHSIIGVIDVFTRRVKVVLKPTSNAEGIALLIRNTILDWGIPEVAKTDNGKDYLSAHILAIWDALEIHNHITNPYSGWEKPFIERFFRTFSHGIAEMLSGYIGHNVSDREKLSARLSFAKRLIERREKGAENVAIDVSLSSDELEAFINSWIDNHYDHTYHSELGCTPFEKFSQHRQTIKRLDNERVLDMLLAPVPSQNGNRTVGKEGISVGGIDYIHAELGAFVGERVHCKHNPKDIGKIYVFNPVTGGFICEAFNPELAGNEITMQHAIEAKRIQKAKLREERDAIKRASKEYDVSNVAMKFLQYRESQNKGLTAFPKPSEQYTSSSTESIENGTQKTEGYTPEQKDELARRRDELNAIEAIRNGSGPTYKNEHEKARHYTQLKLDGLLGPTEKAWLHQYRRDNRRAAQMLDKLFNQTESKGK